MKTPTYIKTLIIGLLLIGLINESTMASADSTLQVFFQQTRLELKVAQINKYNQISHLSFQIKNANKKIQSLSQKNKPNANAIIQAMLRKDKLREQIRQAELAYEIETSKIRYKKGFELIKMIYEKTLGLDHHFCSLQTHQNVAALSNPNAFPSFQKAKNVISKRMGKKQKFKLPKIFDSNPFVSMTFSIVASIFGQGDTKTKEKELDQIACILDFTVRMNTDLNIIYYETEFLKNSNAALKEQCLDLFKDYAKVVDYWVPLDECRREDDWERLYEKIDEYVTELHEALEDPSMASKAYEMKVDLDFSIDRLLQFLNTYNTFVAQGEKYYQKFETILNNYSNESICQNQLPHQFNALKQDISISIFKFNEAYNIAELRGSRLKDLMYGIGE